MKERGRKVKSVDGMKIGKWENPEKKKILSQAGCESQLTDENIPTAAGNFLLRGNLCKRSARAHI